MREVLKEQKKKSKTTLAWLWQKRPPDAHCTPPAFLPLHVNTSTVKERWNSHTKIRKKKKKNRCQQKSYQRKPASMQWYFPPVLKWDVRSSDPSGPSSANAVKGVNGGLWRDLTFVTGAQAELDEQEHQRPHVHSEKRDGRSPTCEGELAGKLPAHSYFPKTRLLLQRQGRILLSLPWGELDTGGCASPYGSMWFVLHLPLQETGPIINKIHIMK